MNPSCPPFEITDNLKNNKVGLARENEDDYDTGRALNTPLNLTKVDQKVAVSLSLMDWQSYNT